MPALRLPLLALAMIAAGNAFAVTPLSQGEETVINFGFATQLGSGIYDVSGRTLQVYRLPFGYTIPSAGESRFTTRLTLPLTLGFLDFKPRDVVDNGLPERIDSLSFVPGIAVTVAVRDDWALEPFAEAGFARDRSSELDQRVYALGLRSRYAVVAGATDWELYNELVHVVVEQGKPGGTDDFTRFRAGLTARGALDASFAGRQPDVLGYGFIELFTDPPAGPADGGRGGRAPLQYEVGITLGTTETIRLWRIPLPRVGFGYRFGEDLSVYRIVFGSPY
jgi:hypothetical protein